MIGDTCVAVITIANMPRQAIVKNDCKLKVSLGFPLLPEAFFSTPASILFALSSLSSPTVHHVFKIRLHVEDG